MRMLKMMVFAAAILASGCGVDLKGLASQVKSRVEGATKTAAKPAEETPSGRLVMFIGVDISGSFMHGRYFNDSIEFLARYIHAHLNGLGGMEMPNALFVGSIGGVNKDEVKTLYPIETFQHRSIEQIEEELHQIFPVGRVNTYTDFNAFFTQVGDMIDQKKLLLKPISIVLMTDGDPDLGPADGGNVAAKYRRLSLSPLEGLSRNITARALHQRRRGQELARRGAAQAREGVDAGRGGDGGLEGPENHASRHAVREAGALLRLGERQR